MENTFKRFDRIKEGVGKFNVRGTTLLIPIMNPLSSPLLGAIFESHGVKVHVLETYKGLELGKAHTSGKECFPCQVTLGDILYFLQKERERLNGSFSSDSYTVFMPGADGPCRFGMYNKFQRIILDSYPEFKDTRILSLTTENGYNIGGLVDQSRGRDVRKMSYTAIIIGDLLERLLWRVRPYERTPGSTNAFVVKAHRELVELFRNHARSMEFEPIFAKLKKTFEESRELIDTEIPRKPLIGVVGEIYVRTHVESNQNLIATLENYGAEVVNASIGEWVNYTTYERLMEVKQDIKFYAGRLRLSHFHRLIKDLVSYSGDTLYQNYRHKHLYKLAKSFLPIHGDHDIGELERRLDASGLFGFQISGETCLSIAGALMYRDHGFDGVVNIYPFTCMPSTVTSAILKPWFHQKKFPYIDAPYDGTFQPGREAAIRTFMYQAQQHLKRNGRKILH